MALLAKKLNKAEMLDKSALTQALYLRHFGSVVSELRSTGSTKKKYGEGYNSTRRKISHGKQPNKPTKNLYFPGALQGCPTARYMRRRKF